jgi:valyl-tRNA synthetase
LPKGGFVVAETPEQALELAKEKTGDANLKMEDLRQEDDCLDTWFSSWLWPISLFDGINNPGNEEIKYYYPTADLVTGPDIIFFWVARMIMAGYEYMGDMPFRNVYFTGIVRDKIGRKMSKSLGNSPDPLELIEQFGADGVRMGMMLAAPAGNDILFDEALCEQGRNFNNNISYRSSAGKNIVKLFANLLFYSLLLFLPLNLLLFCKIKNKRALLLNKIPNSGGEQYNQ